MNNIVSKVAEAKYFSIFIDGSTDKGNVDNELIMVCDTIAEDEQELKFGH